MLAQDAGEAKMRATTDTITVLLLPPVIPQGADPAVAIAIEKIDQTNGKNDN